MRNFRRVYSKTNHSGFLYGFGISSILWYFMFTQSSNIDEQRITLLKEQLEKNRSPA
jgi:hypothetical protein